MSGIRRTGATGPSSSRTSSGPSATSIPRSCFRTRSGWPAALPGLRTRSTARSGAWRFLRTGLRPRGKARVRRADDSHALEVILRDQPHDARVAYGACDRAEGGALDVGLRRAEVPAVERVEDFAGEHDVVPSERLEALAYRQIDVLVAGSAQDADACIAELPQRRGGECRSIDPVFERRVF